MDETEVDLVDVGNVRDPGDTNAKNRDALEMFTSKLKHCLVGGLMCSAICNSESRAQFGCGMNE